MRELLKSSMSFSWAMSLLGMRQMMRLLIQPNSVAKTFDTLTEAADSEFDQVTRSLFRAGDRLQRDTVDTMFGCQPGTRRGGSDRQARDGRTADPIPNRSATEWQRAYRTAGDEQTIVCRSTGTGTVRHGVDGRNYFIVHGRLSDMNGESEQGEFEGVWGASVFTPEVLVSYPDPPPMPFDRPSRPGEPFWKPELNSTKARWIFGDGRDSLIATGPALSRIQIQSNQQTQFWYSVVSFVHGGSGAWDGVRGQATSMGSALFPSVPQPLEGLSFELDAVHVIKVAPQR